MDRKRFEYIEDVLNIPSGENEVELELDVNELKTEIEDSFRNGHEKGFDDATKYNEILINILITNLYIKGIITDIDYFIQEFNDPAVSKMIIEHKGDVEKVYDIYTEMASELDSKKDIDEDK